jgi:hypothetical protein
MRPIVLLFLLALALPASACGFLDPCKPAIQHVKKAKPDPAVVKHEKQINEHARKLATHDAHFIAMAASIAGFQRQIAELKAKR